MDANMSTKIFVRVGRHAEVMSIHFVETAGDKRQTGPGSFLYADIGHDVQSGGRDAIRSLHTEKGQHNTKEHGQDEGR